MELVGKKGHGQWKLTWTKCVNTKVDVKALERLMEPENEEVSLRYILKYSARGGCNIFQLFDTAEKKKDHFVASRKRCLESQGKKATKQESWHNERHENKYQGVLFATKRLHNITLFFFELSSTLHT